MLNHIRPALVFTLLLTLLTGILYPFVVIALSQVFFPGQANGSLIEQGGHIVGSALIGQSFTSDRYFYGRPSATTAPDPADASKTVAAPYNAANSGGSNLGPTSQALMDGLKTSVEKVQSDPAHPVPVDLVTASGSGLDPHITLAAAQFQIARVARARGLPETRVAGLVQLHTENRLLGFFGEPVVNVLKLNLALDAIR